MSLLSSWMIRKSIVLLLCFMYSVLNEGCEMTYGTTGLAGEASEVGFIKKFTLPTLSQCAVECSIRAQCEFYGYGSYNHKCYLYNGEFNRVSSVNLVPDDDVITYYSSICSQTDQRPGRYVKGIPGCLWIPWSRDTFPGADDVCNNNNARVLGVVNQATIDYIEYKRETDGQKFWLDGEQDSANTSIWRWRSTGDVISGNNGGQYWLLNNPTNNVAEKCMAIRYSEPDNTLAMVDRECTKLHLYFCVYN